MLGEHNEIARRMSTEYHLLNFHPVSTTSVSEEAKMHRNHLNVPTANQSAAETLYALEQVMCRWEERRRKNTRSLKTSVEVGSSGAKFHRA